MVQKQSVHGGYRQVSTRGTGSARDDPYSRLGIKLQALVYNILPSTTVVFSYAIGSRKLSANEQFCCWWCSYSRKFVTHNSNKNGRVIYSRQHSLHQHKYNHNRLNRSGTLSFTPGGCDSRLRACLGARLLLQSY